MKNQTQTKELKVSEVNWGDQEDQLKMMHVLSVLNGNQKCTHIDEISKKLNWTIQRCSSTLGLLEFNGYVIKEKGMRFKISDI